MPLSLVEKPWVRSMDENDVGSLEWNSSRTRDMEVIMLFHEVVELPFRHGRVISIGHGYIVPNFGTGRRWVFKRGADVFESLCGGPPSFLGIDSSLK